VCDVYFSLYFLFSNNETDLHVRARYVCNSKNVSSIFSFLLLISSISVICNYFTVYPVTVVRFHHCLHGKSNLLLF